MSLREPVATEDEHRVLKFRPRASALPRGNNDMPRVNDMPRDNGEAVEADEPDDFKHRMLANAAAFAFTAALTGFGIWLAVSISDLRKTQDCVLMGRRDCARLATSPPGETLTEPAAGRH